MTVRVWPSFNDTLTVASALSATDFGGPVKLALGHGNDTAAVDATFGASVNVNGGKGSDSLDWLTSVFAVDAVVVAVETIL